MADWVDRYYVRYYDRWLGWALAFPEVRLLMTRQLWDDMLDCDKLFCKIVAKKPETLNG